jgi:sarcosine oxidase subunit alpha
MTDVGLVRFRYDGTAATARPGETLAAALAHEQLPLLERSIRYHRPRAPFCGIGHCTGCLVRVNGRPNVRACRYVVADGDEALTENAWPSARLDVLGVLDGAFPGGIDTLRGFRRPAWATRLYQSVVRRLAGYGTPPDPGAAALLRASGEAREVDVLVIGAGPSGRAAAERLVERDHRTLLIDRSLSTAPVPGAEVLGASTVAFLPPPTEAGFTAFAVQEPARGFTIRARAVIVATGGYDAALLCGGNERPGAVTADAVFHLAPEGATGPFRRAVVFGGGERARATVERLGSAVSAVVAPGAIAPELTRAASERGIPLYPRSLVLATNGRRRLRSIELATRGGGRRFTLPADTLVLAHRRVPHAQLFFQAGARMAWRGGPGAYYPALDPAGATSVPGLFAAGSAAGFVAEASARSGACAAEAILGAATPVEPLPRVPADGPNELDGYYRELLRLPRAGRWVACPCEDVLLDEVLDASARGYRGIEVVKRYSGLGTGLCQGRYCLPDALLLLSVLEGRPPPEVGYVTQRPPVVPVPIAALARAASPPEAVA